MACMLKCCRDLHSHRSKELQRMTHLLSPSARLCGDLHGVLCRGGKAVEDGRLVRKDAMVWVRHILQHQGEVDWEVPNEVVARPAWFIQLWQTCRQPLE